jgi:hypothetical protein
MGYEDMQTFIEESLKLSETDSLLKKEYYWKQAAISLKKMIELQHEQQEMKRQQVDLEQELTEIENSMQLLVVQDKRLTNETQRKAAINSLKIESEEWRQLNNKELPTVRHEIERLELSLHTLKKVYDLCYAAINY